MLVIATFWTCGLEVIVVVAPFVIFANCKNCVAIKGLPGRVDGLLRLRSRQWRGIACCIALRAHWIVRWRVV
jgi:hypothetical protein